MQAGPTQAGHSAGDAPTAAAADPRVGWTATGHDAAPPLQHRRDGILPAVAAALSVRGETLTSTAHKGDQEPAPHPLVQDFLDTLATEHRSRHSGRCPETVLLSRFLTTAETARTAKRTNRRNTGKPRPLTHSEARRALKHAKITARHIREDGDPLHGRYAPPCRSCTVLLAHFGVRPVDPAAAAEATT
ncbi:YwqJ-related putative deaminase [Streptomyces ovatisporus]|uniref:YwqJ-related putative deaminase n=1 Tax=Streptomyces ovatisporus TaxID=1128682 RepID=A0ABV9A696_9ACTN